MRLVWIVPEQSGGIRSYAKGLWPAIHGTVGDHGWGVDRTFYELPEPRDLLEEYGRGKDLIIHLQHEFGLFGSKIPGFYRFPKWIEQVRSLVTHAKIVATAHAVLGPDFKYPLVGRGWQTPLRMGVNLFMLPWLRQEWGPKTWQPLDGVIVHSSHQLQTIRNYGQPRVVEIPHYVYDRTPNKDLGESVAAQRVGARKEAPEIAVFGYITPEKGQDLVIEAVGLLKQKGFRVFLTIAGGTRRRGDQRYLDYCHQKIRKYDLEDEVDITGFVPEDKIDTVYHNSDLVVIPFRMTSGSGSVAMAMTRGAAVLASDLPLNLEIVDRQPGAMKYFKSGNAVDLADQIRALLVDAPQRALLGQAALAYAEKCSPRNIAAMHLKFYQDVVG